MLNLVDGTSIATRDTVIICRYAASNRGYFRIRGGGTNERGGTGTIGRERL